MKHSLLIPLLLLLPMLIVGCSGSSEPEQTITYATAIPPENRDAAAQWIIKTVEAANPKSDEEPEDNIAQAERTALRLYGRQTIGIQVWGGTFIPYWECTPKQKAMCDAVMTVPVEKAP